MCIFYLFNWFGFPFLFSFGVGFLFVALFGLVLVLFMVWVGLLLVLFLSYHFNLSPRIGSVLVFSFSSPI